MTKILFVCHGNICRSPMAEFMFKNMVRQQGLEDEFEIASAATSREELGNDMYSLAKSCLYSYSVPFEPRKARQITKDDLDYYDYIIAMDEHNIHNLNRLLGSSEKYSLLMDYAGLNREVLDPWYSHDFETCYEDLVKGCAALLKYILAKKNR